MSLRDRIRDNEIRLAEANRQAREEYIERLYSMGYRPYREDQREPRFLAAALCCFALAAVCFWYFALG